MVKPTGRFTDEKLATKLLIFDPVTGPQTGLFRCISWRGVL